MRNTVECIEERRSKTKRLNPGFDFIRLQWYFALNWYDLASICTLDNGLIVRIISNSPFLHKLLKLFHQVPSPTSISVTWSPHMSPNLFSSSPRGCSVSDSSSGLPRPPSILAPPRPLLHLILYSWYFLWSEPFFHHRPVWPLRLSPLILPFRRWRCSKCSYPGPG